MVTHGPEKLVGGHCEVHYSGYTMLDVFFTSVTGDANFTMEQTSLTIGGFTQPAVARTLIELPANIEKGLSTRFLWVFPKPCYAKFASLQPVDVQFTNSLGN